MRKLKDMESPFCQTFSLIPHSGHNLTCGFQKTVNWWLLSSWTLWNWQHTVKPSLCNTATLMCYSGNEGSRNARVRRRNNVSLIWSIKRENQLITCHHNLFLCDSLQSVPLLKGSCEGDSMISLTNENSNIEKFAFHYWHGHKVNVYYFFCVDQDNSDIYHFSKGNLSIYCFSILSIEVCIANCRWCFFFQPFLTIVICDVHFSL